jgi:exosortase
VLIDCAPQAASLCSETSPFDPGGLLLSQVIQVDFPSTFSQVLPRPQSRFWQLVVIAAGVLWLYRSILFRLVQQWRTDENYSHGVLVPVFALFVVWEYRKRLAALPLQPAWSGFGLLAFGLAVLTAGVIGAELFLSRVSLLLVIAGLIALFLGWNHLRALAFPVTFLLLMIPIPQIVFGHITLPLQSLAAAAAAKTLPLLGVPVLREGNVIYLANKTLEVAQACSGIRSLMSLATLAIIYGYLMERRMWVRIVLALASIPIAIVANCVRIVGTGLLVQYRSPDSADGFYHLFSGWLVFLVSLLMLYAVHQSLTLVREKT